MTSMPSRNAKRSGRRQGIGLVAVVRELVIWARNYGRISTSLGDVHRISFAGLDWQVKRDGRFAMLAFQCMRG